MRVQLVSDDLFDFRPLLGRHQTTINENICQRKRRFRHPFRTRFRQTNSIDSSCLEGHHAE